MKIQDIIKKLESEITRNGEKLTQTTDLTRLKEVAKLYDGEDKIISFQDVVERIKAEGEEVRMMSGWGGLDDLLRGFRRQQLIVVSALTKSGKTSWLMDLTTRLKEFNPLWFPFEESADELVRKFLERGEEPPKAYTPSVISGNTIDWLESKIAESIAKNDTRIVVIDQLDFIVPMTADSHALRIGQVMRDLKAIAKKWDITIFLICHLVKTRMDTQPTLEDLKGSSSIGQEADTVIMLWREMKRESGQVVITNNVNLSVQANRRTGRTGNVKMVFVNGHFLEQEWISDREAETVSEKEFATF